MSDLSDLYQEVILDHNRRPRNFRVLEKPSHHAEGFNPLCGDRLDLFLSTSRRIGSPTSAFRARAARSRAPPRR